MVYDLLTSKSLRKRKEKHQANHHGHISENSNTFSRRTSGKSFERYSRIKALVSEMTVPCMLLLPEHLRVRDDVEVKDNDTDDPHAV